MATPNPRFRSPAASRRVTAKQQRRRRQGRAEIISKPRSGVSLLAVLQIGIACLVITGATIPFDWLQPLEIGTVVAITAIITTFLILAFHTDLSNQVRRGLEISAAPLIVVCVLSISAASFAVIGMSAKSLVFTDRSIAEAEEKVTNAIQNGNQREVILALEHAVAGADSEYWSKRWQERLDEIRDQLHVKVQNDTEMVQEERNPSPFIPSSEPQQANEVQPAGESAVTEDESDLDHEEREQSNAKESELGAQQDGQQTSKWTDSINRMPSVSSNLQAAHREGVLSRVVELQAANKYSAAASLLRELIREQPKSEWEGDYEQWYVDHWIDWGNVNTDLDQRYFCYMRALHAARGFGKDQSIVSRLLVDLESEIVDLPTLLPAGCRIRIHELDRTGDTLTIDLSVLSAEGTYVSDLTEKDFAVASADNLMEVQKVVTGSTQSRPTKSSTIILLDQSVSDPITAQSRVDSACRFFAKLPSGSAKQLMTFSLRTDATGWTSDDHPDPFLLVKSMISTSKPALRRSIESAMAAIKGREGNKNLIIVSTGREQSEPYSTSTSLLQRAAQENIRVYAIVSGSAQRSVSRLLTDLSRSTGGHIETISSKNLDEAWAKLAPQFPEGNYRLAVKFESSPSRVFQITVGRGATRLQSDFDFRIGT